VIIPQNVKKVTITAPYCTVKFIITVNADEECFEGLIGRDAVAGQQELILDVQQALPGEGVQEEVELVLGVGDVVLCKGQLCSCKISARPRGLYKNLTGKLIG
jgi:hypothetical protein